MWPRLWTSESWVSGMRRTDERSERGGKPASRATHQRFSVDELLRMACIYAEQDREAFIQAYAGLESDDAAVEAVQFLKQLRSYRRKRWGQSRRDVLDSE